MATAHDVLRPARMNCTETIEPHDLGVGAECAIHMPLGLLGFEQCKRFALVASPEEEPFLWLQSAGEPKLAFLVVSPFVIVPSYRPEISDEDARFLGLEGPEGTLIFNIVTVRGPREATVNLKGPIVLNRRTLVAKQVIPVNAQSLSVAHPLPVQSN
jgi:flagellar assembly factor FliW